MSFTLHYHLLCPPGETRWSTAVNSVTFTTGYYFSLVVFVNVKAIFALLISSLGIAVMKQVKKSEHIKHCRVRIYPALPVKMQHSLCQAFIQFLE